MAVPIFSGGASLGAISGNETIKVALVGCGSRGTGAVSQALRTQGPIKLWAMADLFADRLESSLSALMKGEAADYDRDAYQGFVSKIDVPPERRFIGFDAYRNAMDSGADLVILATPPQFRPEHYAYAVQRNLHVFMEKPVAVDAPGIRRVLEANEEAKRKNLKVVVGLMLRHNLRIQETVKRLQDGAIGDIFLLRCYWNMGSMRDTPPRSPDVSEMIYQLRNPYHFLWLSGDYIIDALLHFVDLCCWAKGGHPIRAQGQGGKIVRSDTQHGDTYDHHFVEFTFADGTVMAAQTRQINGCWTNSAALADGTAGNARIDHGVIEGASAWRHRGKVPNPYQTEHDVWIDAIRRDQTHNEVDYAASSTMTAIMGRMASYSGQLVTWESAFNSTLRLGPETLDFYADPPVKADAQGNYPTAIPGVNRAF